MSGPASGASKSDRNQSSSTSEFAIKYCRDKSSIPRLEPIGRSIIAPSKPAEGNLDAIAYVIHCTKHGALAVYQDASSSIKWLPFTPILADTTWLESATFGALLALCDNKEHFEQLRMLTPFTAITLLEIQRVQLPQTLHFLQRMIFYVKLNPECTGLRCCTSSKTITWMTHKELAGGLDNLWGPELVQYSRVVAANFEGYDERIEEFNIDDVYLYSPRDPPRNAEERMLLELNISEKTIEVLYNDFLDHCWPSLSLPIDSFKHYLRRYGLHPRDDRLNALFLAFNYLKNGFITFHELLLGLVALEPLAIHSDTRIKFIFRFYDAGSKGFLDMEDVTKLTADLNQCNGVEELRKQSLKLAELVGTTTRNEGVELITFGNFHDAIVSQRLRGTSKLCRSKVHVFLQLTKAFIRRKRPVSDGHEWKDLSKVVISRNYQGVCKKCTVRKYRLATHTIRIDGNGNICKSTLLVMDNPAQVPTGQGPEPLDKHSIEFVFNSKSVSNELLGMIREFAKSKGTVAEPRGLLDNGPKEHKKMYEMLVKLVKEAKALFMAESRMPTVASPCYVIGDIHGNLEDLLTLEKLIWKSSAPCSMASYLFLGDYVDRGKWGFECAVYLMALKVLCPAKVTMLRGNHEIRTLQEKYSYKRECLQKYGADYGERIWELTNELFDTLPVAATVEEKIFCTHGGLSPNLKTTSQLRDMPVPLANPEQDSKIAWELLWSDPCHMQQFLDIIELTELSSTVNEFAQEGFLYNSKRGAAYLFNERAATKFLKNNGMSCMIRAHEVPAFGFAHHFTNVCTTVFSCSHYCSNENEAAVILIVNGTLRAVRIDTHNNSPATEK